MSNSQPAISLTISGVSASGWFEYPVRVQPHHTDYAGIVWHGSYIAWMEEARVEYLRSLGLEYADLVALGCDLPVVELSIRYHRPLKMGMTALVKTCLAPLQGVRLEWDYKIESPDRQYLYLTSKVTLVPFDRSTGRIMRRLPPQLKDITKLWSDNFIT
ncbi:MAG: acyl-CoA thioesterase [Oscillatoriaceae bacterium SKW80]|nr:acyl-CoA thioesterase [Oscillatoriaceae bacterium SKYG93]MCX8121182.1 acyl-CoA thioesterase [Oscillatoriaceae bacterium SKW80]MDW8453488.1 thioesterase family protein [Oscillatoriaceae cyanobacterium SKYGB_i_bin93]HIK26838.1 acyl-CoA thioesterase [Oscillatoriaceae cyanobacterium M7585_C2015_266]